MSAASDVDLSQLPSMTVLLAAAESFDGLQQHPRVVLTEALRDVLNDLRQELTSSVAAGAPAGRRTPGPSDFEIRSILSRAKSLIQSREALRLTRVINATGVLLHTGLGRSVLPKIAAERVQQAAGYCNLEIDLGSGKRGRRGQYAEQILCQLTGAEAALVVNNNAAATMLVLHALASGREVIVSRGQLIEIGGSYRLPEVMVAGGAILRDIGTTNKTYLSDYESAISDKTALVMHVHTSNYRVVGFTESPAVAALVALAHGHDLPLFDDLGSGALLDDDLWSAAAEPTVVDSLRHGADVVAFSGDKLLGGPQAGILLGKRAIIDRMQKDPMARALRIGKLTAAALEATLELYLSPQTAKESIPTLAALSESADSIASRAEILASLLRRSMPTESFVVAGDESFAGGGSLPAWPMPTSVVRWKPKSSLDELTRRLRLGNPAVLPRVKEGDVLFDLRTLADSELDDLVRAVASVARVSNP